MAVNMESMWSRLPSEILESKILPFLPIPSLCRFRTVCKKWDSLIIHDPEFASTHARAMSSSLEEHALITIRADFLSKTLGVWEVLDMANNKIYAISNDFLTKFVKQECRPKRKWSHRTILAADGGLLFVVYSGGRNLRYQVLVVCNPVLRTAKLLPSFPGREESFEYVVMSTDGVSMQYEIRVFHLEGDHYQPNSMDIYESKTGRWRTVVINSTLPRPSSGKLWWYGGSVFVKCKLNSGFFYRLVKVDGQLHPRLDSYDEITGVASDLGFDLPVIGDVYFDFVELVPVGKDRLFCVVRRGAQMSDHVKIFEVMVARKECIECAEMPSLEWFLGDDLDHDCDNIMECVEDPDVSIGCASSILLCSCVGRTVAYNVVDKSWHQYSDNKYLEAHEHFRLQSQMLCSNYCPSLCAP